MKKTNLFLLTLFSFYILSCSPQEEISGNNIIYSKEELLKDFDQLVHSLKTLHPMPFTDMVIFASRREKQRAKIKDMGKIDFMRIIAPVIESVNCGHSYMLLETDPHHTIFQDGSFLPFEIRIIDEEIFVYSDLFDRGIQPGSQILSINKSPSTGILEGIFSSLSSDGDIRSSKKEIINSRLPFYYLYYFYIESPKNFLIRYTLPGSTEIREDLIAPASLVDLSMISEYRYEKYGIYETPYYELHKDHALLKIPHFNYYQKEQYKEFKSIIETFFHKVDELELPNLVLDLRGNSGGDPLSGRLLLTYLLQNPFRYLSSDSPDIQELKQKMDIQEKAFKGNLFTLIDGACFSTTGHVLSILKDQERGLLIGQETGGGFLCSDNSKKIVLRSTKISISVATMSFATDVYGQPRGRGIIPDQEIRYTMEDYLNQIDLEMAFVRQKILANSLE